jgi:hypothetical protein
MEADLEGSVAGLQLPHDHGLWPVFEAMHNAFDAIADRQKTADGFEPLITITIQRRASQMAMPGMLTEPITGATISDNGIGLDTRNWEAFNKLYTRHKAKIGGRGVGRLTWLKVFDRAVVESRAREEGGVISRAFRFSLPAGISGLEESKEDLGEPGTTVRLMHLKESYSNGLNVKPKTIARRIVEHFLTFFVLDDAVPIQFVDGDYEVTLQEVYDTIVQAESTATTQDVAGEPLGIQHFLVRGYPGGRHEVRWCARGRIVEDESHPLTASDVPALGARIGIEDQLVVYFCYVTSPLLTRSVNQERTRFSIPEQGTENRPGMADLRLAVMDAVKNYLSPLLEERREAIATRLREFEEVAPQYRHIIRDHADLITHVSPDWGDRKLEVELAKVRAAVEYDTRERARSILSKGIQPDSEKLQELTNAITAAQRADLAGYVAHRRIVLDLVRNVLRYREGHDSYPFERDLHQIIFPMRADSTQLTGAHEEHNLWVLDERLAFYNYIASDKEFRATDLVVDGESDGRRPDLLALDRVAAFGFGDVLDLRGITLVEFKRAAGMETKHDDPVERLIEYTRLIRAGKLQRADGMRVAVDEGVPIYAFAVCNVTHAFEEKLDDIYKANRMADGSWFISREKQRLQIHVVPYTVAITNAEKRSAVFFDKAGLSTVKG